MFVNELITQSGNVAAALNLASIDTKKAKVVGLYINTVVATPAAVTFTAAVTDICTAVAHGYATGLRVAATTTGTLPAGLSATNYWIIKIDADTFKLASSAANALAGTAVDITGTGTGVHTLTPAAITGGSYKVQVSPDNILWFDLASITNNVTATADFMHQLVDPSYSFVRVVWAVTTGQIAYDVNTVVKEL